MIGSLMMLSLVSSGSAADLHHRLERLATPLRALYVAAHPDDENSQLLAYLARGRGIRTGYLSLTRGDGGQNLIGKEQRPLLSVIRTQELLAARRLDGAEQWFTRLRDFGYSKSAEETLRKWGDEQALVEVVRVVRSFRPHVILTRFPETGDTHGHHLASAQLARRAFAAAADPNFPVEASGTTQSLPPWTVRRLFYNYPHFWASRGGEPPPGFQVEVEVNGYDPWLGASFGEISALARTQHKSQGFGASARVGPWKETFVLLEGDEPKGGDLFDGLPGWDDLLGGLVFGEAVAAAKKGFDPARPGTLVPLLGRAHHAAGRIEDRVLGEQMRAEVESLIVAAAGLLVEARADTAEVPAGGIRELSLLALCRAEEVDVVLRAVEGPGFRLEPREVLAPGEPWKAKANLRAPDSLEPGRPHWLGAEPEEARYPVEPALGIRPDLPSALEVTFELGVGGVGVRVSRVPRRHWVDPVLGERTEPLEGAPPLSVTPEVSALYVPVGGSAPLAVDLEAGPEGFEGTLGVEGDLRVEPPATSVKLGKNDKLRVLLRVSASAATTGRLAWTSKGGPLQPAWRKDVVDHDHIPRVVVRSPAVVRLSPVKASLPKGRIGYVPGPGDAVFDVLQRLGADIETLDAQALASADLSRYRAIVTGVRAFNVNGALLTHRDRLFSYVEGGGTLLVQYNTQNWSGRLEVPTGPLPITIERDRVSDETADVTLLVPDHPLLSIPHRITPNHFDAWVQERGLYFASKWDPKYVPLFRMGDPGETPLDGSTLVLTHGEGTYIYTGLSFFRQLPVAHPGALRLFLNLLGGGKR